MQVKYGNFGRKNSSRISLNFAYSKKKTSLLMIFNELGRLPLFNQGTTGEFTLLNFCVSY